MDPAELWSGPARRQRWLALMEMLDPQEGQYILDVGCGHGKAVRYLAARVGTQGTVVGIDTHVSVVAELNTVLQEAQLSQASAQVADATALPFADSTFDAIVCVNVLEAFADRARALAEIRRVLRPGGRALVAHDDHESQAYVCDNRVLGRRVVQAYADGLVGHYQTSEPQMGRRLWSLFVKAGFERPSLSVLPLVETEYQSPHMGWILSQFPADVVAGSEVTREDLAHWREDLTHVAARGEYLYCINLYVCIGYK
jgi:arsenite methyltransferase